MRNTRIFGLFAIAAIIAVFVWAATLPSTAQNKASFAPGNRCNTFNLAGNYAYTAFGTILPDHPLGYPPGPYTTAGVVTLNQDGSYDLHARTSVSGTFLEESVSDVYTIDESCAVTLMYSGMPFTITYTTEDRKDIFGIVLVPKTNVAIIGSRK